MEDPIRIAVAVFGDASGCPLAIGHETAKLDCKSLTFSENAVWEMTADAIVALLADAAQNTDYHYCFIAPKMTTRSRRGMKPSIEGPLEDEQLEARLAQLPPSLSDWRIAVLRTGRSEFASGSEWTQPTLEGCSWVDWRCSFGAFGGDLRTHVRLSLRGFWPRRISPRDWRTDQLVDGTASAACMEAAWRDPAADTPCKDTAWVERRRVTQQLIQAVLQDDVRS